MSAETDGVKSGPGPARFELGALAWTVISDGTIDVGPLEESLCEPGAGRSSPSRGDTRATLDINLLVLEADGVRVLFDAGAGSAVGLGLDVFGPSVGHAPEGLRAVGIDPASIDLIALSHAHPDHAWGLIDADDEPCFPNAKIVVGSVEFNYWMSEGPPACPPDDELGRLISRGAQRALRAYEDRIIAVEDGFAVTPAVTAREFPGHSPGHVVYEIAAGDDRLVLWGDICHHAMLLADPTVSVVFDYDPVAASQSRLKLLAAVTNTRIGVFAYHLPFPGLGRVTGSLSAGYAWRPWGECCGGVASAGIE